MELLKVYEANNGDIFFQFKNDYKEHSKEEIKELIFTAQKEYENGNFEKCLYKEGKFIKNGGYYSIENEFLGSEQIHVLNEYTISQDCIYLKYSGNLKSFWEK